MQSIEISVQMFEFQKRFWWMLSSLLQQKSWQDNPVPDIKITVSVMPSIDRYKGLTQDIIETFDKHLDLEFKEYANLGRGILRSNDLKNTKADWILFTDADMLFHPEFFSEMSTNHLHKWKKFGNLITIPRMTISRPTSCDLVKTFDYSSKKSIENAFEKCWAIREGYSRRGRTPGAGYFQLVETEYIKDNNITYCDRRADASLFSKNGNKFRSDIIFRRKMNGVVAIKKEPDETGSRDILKPVIHLNHWRQNDEQWTNEGN